MDLEPVTREQAAAATHLVNVAGSFGALLALAGQLPPPVLEALKAAHEASGTSCAARWEGLICCVDILLEDPAKYAPERVAQAEDLLRRYRESLTRQSGPG